MTTRMELIGPAKEFVRRAVDTGLGRNRPSVPAGLKLPPALPGGLPLVGHSVDFVKDTIGLLFRAQREMGEISSFTVFNRKMVAMFGPDAHEAVFRAPDTQLSPSEAYKIMTPVFGKDVVYDASPEKMGEQVKMLLPALKDKRMRTYGEAVIRETSESVARWGEAGVVDFVEFCRVLTNFTSSRCLLGKEFRENMSEEFAAVYHDLEKGVTPLAYINAHLPIPSFRKRDKARVKMVEMISRVVQARRRDKREGEDFLQTLMDARYGDGKPLSEHEITGLVLAGMFAGHHTSSVTTAWTLIELLRNPLALARAKEEIDRVFAGGREVSHAALRELDFVENCVKESLRLNPPLFMLVRVAKVDFVYKNYFIPAGSWILISPTVAHRMHEVFANPNAFDPDRYAPPREEDKRDFAYIAFGGGRHKCLGNAFALLQVKAIMAMLIGQYDFQLAGDTVQADFHGLVIGPKEPCRIRYKKRENASVSIETAAALEKMASADPSKSSRPSPDGARKGECPVDHSAMQAHKTNGADAQKPVAKKLTIRLDHDLCQGHATCTGEAPEVFFIGKNGKVAAKTFSPSPELHEKVRAAERYCPNRAIRIREG
jgi:sterol 14-demethylase